WRALKDFQKAPSASSLYARAHGFQDIRQFESRRRIEAVQGALRDYPDRSIRGVIVVGSTAADQTKPDSDLDVMLLETHADNFLFLGASGQAFIDHLQRTMPGIEVHPLMSQTVVDDSEQLWRLTLAMNFLPPHLIEGVVSAHGWRTPGASLIRDYVVIG